MGRAPCCDKANVKKGPWSPEEDAKLKSYIEQNGTGGNWIALPQKIGLKRCGKSCRLRWLNYLRPNIKHGGFSEEEDNLICSLYINIGSRWSIIAAQLPGRTDNDIKNYWNTRLKKKLLGKQRKEQPNLRREIKPETAYTFTSPPPTTAAYWPEPPCPAAAINSIPIQPQDSNFIPPNDQDSLRALLIKLGGRFSDNGTDSLYLQDQTYVNSVEANLLSSSSTNFVDNSYGVNEMFQGFGDLVYGTGSSYNGVSSVESSSWGNNVNCLEYPQLVSEFENCLNLPQEHSPFEVSSYFGTQ